jgi:hypothetical protein
MGIFCDPLYSVFLLSAILGLDFLGPPLSRPQVLSRDALDKLCEDSTGIAGAVNTFREQLRKRAEQFATPQTAQVANELMPLAESAAHQTSQQDNARLADIERELAELQQSQQQMHSEVMQALERLTKSTQA